MKEIWGNRWRPVRSVWVFSKVRSFSFLSPKKKNPSNYGGLLNTLNSALGSLEEHLKNPGHRSKNPVRKNRCRRRRSYTGKQAAFRVLVSVVRPRSLGRTSPTIVRFSRVNGRLASTGAPRSRASSPRYTVLSLWEPTRYATNFAHGFHRSFAHGFRRVLFPTAF